MVQNLKPDLKHRSYHFSISVIRFIKECSSERLFYSVIDQLLRSATSIGANIVEGSAGSSKRDFIKYYEIALKSANETKYWLCIFRDGLDTDQEKTNKLLKEADEISKILARSILTLKSKKER
jgi:four helix bundle protein